MYKKIFYIMNPFEQIEIRLDRLERLISNSLKKDTKVKEKRFVNLDEFVSYSGMSKNTIYAKLSRGEGIAGAFKAGPKRLLVDLDEWDKYLENRKAEYQS